MTAGVMEVERDQCISSGMNAGYGANASSPVDMQAMLAHKALDDQARAGTLELVGRELGLSKERVRQVQAGALEKLRAARMEGGATS